MTEKKTKERHPNNPFKNQRSDKRNLGNIYSLNSHRLPGNNRKVFSWKFCVYCLFFYEILRGSLMGLYQKAELSTWERSLEQFR